MSSRAPWLRILSILLGSSVSLLGLEPAPQPLHYRSQTWTVRDGLPQNSVNAVVQDPEGYLWIATFGGLVRFNGHEFRDFPSARYPGLRTDRIVTLTIDRDGLLWVGTQEEGLAVRHSTGFRTLGPAEGVPPTAVILALLQSRSGTMYVGTQDGLLQSDSRDFRRWSTRDGLPHNRVDSLLEDRQGVLWVGTFHGLCRKTDHGFETVSDPGLPPFVIRSLAEGRDGTLWVGTDRGLFRRTPEGFRRVPLDNGRDAENVTALLEDGSGVLWAGLEPGGVFRIDGGNARRYLAAGWAPDESVTSFFEDTEGSLWIGTNGNGLHQLVKSRIMAYGGLRSPLDMPVRTILEDGQGGWWIGTFGRGLAHLAPTGGITFPTDGTPLERALVLSLLRDEREAIWIGTENDGLFVWEEGRVSSGPDLPPESRTVMALWMDSDGRLLIGTGNGLFSVEGKDGTVRTIPGTGGLIVRFIHPRTDGLWLGTDTGVHRLTDSKRETWNHARGLSHDSVRALYTDTDDGLWIGTYGGGLNRLKNGHVTRFDTSDQLDDRTVSFIVEDAQGTLWMTGNRGVHGVSRRALDNFAGGGSPELWVRHLTEEDGLITQECNGGSQPAGALTPDGRLAVPTIRGVAVIAVAEDSVLRAPPPSVRIERMLTDGREMPLGGPVSLPPDIRDVEVEYAILSYAAPKDIRSQYRIEGLNDGWVTDDGRFSARFGSLPPGRFRFHVIGGRADGVWNREGAGLDFTVRPHIHQTWWFWACCGMVMVLLGYGILRIRTAALRAREIHLQAEVNTRSEALVRSEWQYRNLVETSPDVICTHDLHGTILSSNPAGWRLIGIDDARKASDLNLRDLVDPEYLPLLPAYLKSVRRKGNRRGIVRIRTPQGDRRILEYHNSLRNGGDATVVQVIARDVTALHQARKALEENEARHRFINENTSSLTAILSLSLPPEFLYLNPAFQTLGYVPETLIGTNALDLLHPEDAPRLLDRLRQVMKSLDEAPVKSAVRIAEPFAGRIKDRQGEWRELKGQAHLVTDRILLVCEDITERSRTQRALRAAEEKYSALVRNSPIGIYQGIPCQRTVSINPAMLAMLGHDTIEEWIEADIEGRHWMDAEQQRRWRETIEREGIHRNHELVLRRKDGTPIILLENSRAIRDANGAILYVESTLIDISKQKLREEELRESEARFRQVVESIGEGIGLVNEAEVFEFTNPAADRIFGVPAGELVGRSLIEFLTPEERARVAEETVNRRRGVTSSYELEIAPRGGGARQILLTASPRFGSDGAFQGTFAVFRDISALKAAETELLNVNKNLERVVELRTLRLQESVAWLEQEIVERKRVEEALRHSEREYKELFNNMLIGAYRTTPDGRILKVNPALIAMLGYSSAEELLAQNLENPDVKTRYSRERFVEKLHREGRVKGVEWEWTKKDGTPAFVRENAQLIHGAQGEVYYDGTVEDITEQRKAESRLRLLHKAIHSVPVGVTIVDADGRIVFTNPAEAEMHGYSVEELQGRFARILAPSPLGQEPPPDQWVSYIRESVNIRKDGSLFPVQLTSNAVEDLDGNPMGLVTICEDISRRKQTELKLRRLEAAIEQATEHIFITDARGLIEYVNPAFTQVTGYTPDEVLGRTPAVLKSGAHDAEFYADLWRTILSGRSWVGEFINQRKDGTRFEEVANISPLFDERRGINGFLAVKRDVTQERRLQKQFRERERLASIGELAGAIAHEIKNPLFAITGGLQVLEMELPLDPEQRSYLKTVLGEGLRIDRLIRKLRAYSHPIQLERRPTVLGDVLASAVLAVQGLARQRQVRVVSDPIPAAPLVAIDPDKMTQVLFNLLQNALEASQPGGTIRASMAVTGSHIELSVCDDGAGIPTKVMGRIFDPLFTTKAGNTGLGLFIVRSIIVEHGGDIDVASDPGEETRVTVRLPLGGAHA